VSGSLRRIRRRIASGLVIGLSGLAARGGAARTRRIGRALGAAHFALTRPFQRRLRRDIARALGVERREAAKLLARAYRENDRAVFEVLTLAHPACRPDALVDTVAVEDAEQLRSASAPGRGVILLGMHMGNGILMAARLARDGWPVHVVFRDPRRLPPGLLGRSLERAGCVPLPLDRRNPTRSFRRMLGVLRDGGVLFVLMDQANKSDGAERTFLGKRLRMPTGIAGLAVRTGAPVVPVQAESAHAGWRFRVLPPLIAEDAEHMIDAMVASMEAQIRARPALWAWHHRRWKRYHFEPEAPTDPARPCP
jgi:KDO2-lipid IV(A) lauroyltransferase